jgi:hypothetical protein
MLKEQKSYDKKSVILYIKNSDIIREKLAEMNYINLEYDDIFFITDIESIKDHVHMIFPDWKFHQDQQDDIKHIIDITYYEIPTEYSYIFSKSY